jgi:hypothetical protein
MGKCHESSLPASPFSLNHILRIESALVCRTRKNGPSGSRGRVSASGLPGRRIRCLMRKAGKQERRKGGNRPGGLLVLFSCFPAFLIHIRGILLSLELVGDDINTVVQGPRVESRGRRGRRSREYLDDLSRTAPSDDDGFGVAICIHSQEEVYPLRIIYRVDAPEAAEFCRQSVDGESLAPWNKVVGQRRSDRAEL